MWRAVSEPGRYGMLCCWALDHSHAIQWSFNQFRPGCVTDRHRFMSRELDFRLRRFQPILVGEPISTGESGFPQAMRRKEGGPTHGFLGGCTSFSRSSWAWLMTDFAHGNTDHDLSFIAETRAQVQQLFDAFEAGRVQVSPELVAALSQIREQLMAIKLDGSLQPEAANQRIAACVQIVRILPKPATAPSVPPSAKPIPTVSPALTAPRTASAGTWEPDHVQSAPFDESGSQEHVHATPKSQGGQINPVWAEPDAGAVKGLGTEIGVMASQFPVDSSVSSTHASSTMPIPPDTDIPHLSPPEHARFYQADPPAGGASWPPPNSFPFAGATAPPGRGRFPRWPMRLAAGLVAVSLVAAGAWKLQRKQPKNLITAQVEAQVYSSTWIPFVDAMNGGGLAMMKQVATPSTVQAMIGYLSCGCSPWSPTPLTYNFGAPIETKYPLYFYAEMQDNQSTDGSPITLEIEFTKATAKSPWLVANAGGYSGDSMLITKTSGANFYFNAKSKAPLPLQDGPVALDNYFQEIDSTGVIPPLPTHWYSDAVLESDASQAASAYQLNKTQGLTQQVTHTITEMSPPIGLGRGAVIFATQAIHETVTSNGTHLIKQPTDQSAFGPGLPPGSYSKVIFDSTNDICIFENSQGVFQMLTNTGGTYSTKWVRASSWVAS
jgi:hypothetical protein